MFYGIKANYRQEIIMVWGPGHDPFVLPLDVGVWYVLSNICLL